MSAFLRLALLQPKGSRTVRPSTAKGGTMSTSGSGDISSKFDDGPKDGAFDHRSEAGGPPIAPVEIPIEDRALRQSVDNPPPESHEPAPAEQDSLAALEPDHADIDEKSSRPRGKLIVGAVIACVAVGALAYF